jgi:ubiquinone/menaquinone biosynthesis C-methylase UbiE
MDSQTYWENAHTKYSKQSWITKPTIFATQAINYYPRLGDVLDLGTGQSQDAFYFARHAYSVPATDFSQFALKQAKATLASGLESKMTFQDIDLSSPLPFAAESFDVVYSHLALHYFTEERTHALFNEIYTILKPGGIFATLANTIEDPEVPELTKIADEYYQTPEGIYKRFFSVASMKIYTTKFQPLLLDDKGETHKDEIKTLIRFVGKK